MSKLSAIVLTGLFGYLCLILKPHSFTKPEGSSRRATCIGNLTQLNSAKEQWAMDHHKKAGDLPFWKDIIGPYIKNKATCPEGGVYVLGPVAKNPQCSHVIGENPHVMP